MDEIDGAGGVGGVGGFGEGPSLSPAPAGAERVEDAAPGLRVVVVSVGNTNAAYSVAKGSRLEKPRRGGSGASEEIAAGVAELVEDGPGEGEEPVRGVVVASVNEPAAEALVTEMRSRVGVPIYRVGRDVGLPLRHSLSEAAIERTGQDRLLNAVAAFDSARQAVVVVDAGTAITVDFVDGEGVFCGGAIAAGVRASLGALADRAPALPRVEVREPAEGAFGVDTEEAMLQGVKYGAQGLVRRLVERYAMAYEAYPMVVATGGDAAFLFEDDELVDRVVPHLTLRGIAVACQRSLGVGGAFGAGSGEG